MAPRSHPVTREGEGGGHREGRRHEAKRDERKEARDCTLHVKEKEREMVGRRVGGWEGTERKRERERRGAAIIRIRERVPLLIFL